MKLLIPMALMISTLSASADEHYEIKGTRDFTEVVEFTPKSDPMVTCVIVRGLKAVSLECFPKKQVSQRVSTEVEL